jgi:hypothetical protein
MGLENKEIDVVLSTSTAAKSAVLVRGDFSLGIRDVAIWRRFLLLSNRYARNVAIGKLLICFERIV